VFSENDRISTRQVFRLFVFDFLGESTLVLPQVLAGISGTAGVISIVLGGVLASIILWLLLQLINAMDGDLLSFVRSRYIYIFLVLIFVCLAGYGAYLFSDVVKYSLLQGTAYSLILLVILLLSGYAVWGGIESRARVFEVLFVLLFVLLFIMLLIAAKNLNLEYLSDFGTFSAGKTAGGSLLVLMSFLPVILVLFLPAHITKNNRKKMAGAVCKAIWFSVVVIAALYVVLLGNFGSAALSTMRYPAVVLMSSIQLRGSFLKRLDAFLIGIWFFTLFAFVSVFMFYGKEILSHKFRLKKRRSVAVMLVLIFAAAELFNMVENRDYSKNSVSSVELEDRCFPMAATIDFRLDKIEFSYAFPELSQKDNTDVEESKVDAAMALGNDLEESYNLYKKELSKTVDCNHMKVLVLGTALINSDQYETTLDYLRQTELFPRNTLVCMTDDPSLLYEIEDNLPEDMGTYLESYLQKQSEDLDFDLPDLGALLDAQVNRNSQPALPYLDIEEGAIILEK
jgi:translation initiation factor 2 beta subunit (eIF-2beta)/eIF-5